MRMSAAMMQQATGGVWHGSTPEMIDGICTDTRRFRDGDAFLALRGPNFDGHAFAASVADRAAALIGDRRGMTQWRDLQIGRLEVTDTLCAFGDIAHAWRMRLADTCVIAISGSYGKTSLRSLLQRGFSALGFRVAATRENLNNLIGVPQTLLSVPADAEIAVIECGISERGEMARLAAIAQPDIAVLTGISAAHGEGLGGVSGVAREKALLLQGLNESGWCVLGSGVASMLTACDISLPDNSLIVDRADDDAVGWQLRGRRLRLTYRDEACETTLSLPAAHWAANYALAAAIMLRLLRERNDACTLADVGAALSGWQPPAGRLLQRRARGGARLLDDSYNANPASMQAAIDTLRALPGRHFAILGDMAELGDDAAAAHAAIDAGRLDGLWLVGPQMQTLAGQQPQAHCCADADAAAAALADIAFEADDTILVKGSRSMRLERVVAALAAEEAADAL